MQKIEFNEENFKRLAPLNTREELAKIFECSLNLIDTAKRIWNVKTKRGAVGRPSKLIK